MSTREANYHCHCVGPPAEARTHHGTVVLSTQSVSTAGNKNIDRHFVAQCGTIAFVNLHKSQDSNPDLMNEFQFVGESSPDECAPAAEKCPQPAAVGATNLTGAA